MNHQIMNHRMRVAIVGIVPVVAVGIVAAVLTAAEPMRSSLSSGTNSTAAIPVSREFQQFVSELTAEMLPRHYVDNRKWGQQRDFVAGLYVRRDGWKLDTHRTYRKLNHGTWQRYEVTLLDPQRLLDVQVGPIRPRVDGTWACPITCDGWIRAFGRVARWERGVQLASVSAAADLQVRLSVQAYLQVQLSAWPLHVNVLPSVSEADLQIVQIRVNQVSQLRGSIAALASTGVREIAEDVIARKRARLVERINDQLRRKGQLSLGGATLAADR